MLSGPEKFPGLSRNGPCRSVKLEQKICFNLQSKKARSVLSSQSSVKNIGLTLKQCEGKSHRVCSAYGRKIRALHHLYSFDVSIYEIIHIFELRL